MADDEDFECDHEPRCNTAFRHKTLGIQFAGASERSITVRARDRQFAKDNASYRRLRKEGLQPAHVDGSSVLEARADTKREVERGRLYAPELRRRALRAEAVGE